LYTVSIKRSAQKALIRLPENDYQRVFAAIEALANDPRPEGSKKLKGRDGWRLRIGNYRVIYEINDRALAVLVVDVVHRREAYR
jgi:mRNA interferase RelE/StbE